MGREGFGACFYASVCSETGGVRVGDCRVGLGFSSLQGHGDRDRERVGASASRILEYSTAASLLWKTSTYSRARGWGRDKERG